LIEEPERPEPPDCGPDSAVMAGLVPAIHVGG
jgi:hypothetical protein